MLAAYLLNAGSELWGKKWRNAILFHLTPGPMRFSELKRLIPDCSVKMLSTALDEMEKDGLVIRKQYPGIPVKVTYELGQNLEPLVDVLQRYYKALVFYFHKHPERLNAPEHIVEMIKQERFLSSN